MLRIPFRGSNETSISGASFAPMTARNRSRAGSALFVSVSAGVLMWGGAALAAPADSSASGVTEVVVTAEHRVTNLQTTPVAASVLTGADLEARGVTAEDQIQFATPSANLENSGQSNNLNIRGIGKSETASTTVVGVIIYRDGLARIIHGTPENGLADVA